MPRGFYPRRTYRSKRTVHRKGAKLTYRQKRQVKQLIGRRLERKFIDTVSTLTGVTSTGTLLTMSSPAQGAGQSQRVGDSITVKSIDLNYSVVGYDATNMVRVILFKWKNDDAAYAPSVSSILTAAQLVQDTAPFAQFNWDNMKSGDFRICYDRVHSLSYNNAAASPGSAVQAVRKKIVGKRLHGGLVELTAGTTTGEGVYFLLVISDSAAIGHPKFNYSVRIEYTDA